MVVRDIDMSHIGVDLSYELRVFWPKSRDVIRMQSIMSWKQAMRVSGVRVLYLHYVRQHGTAVRNATGSSHSDQIRPQEGIADSVIAKIGRNRRQSDRRISFSILFLLKNDTVLGLKVCFLSRVIIYSHPKDSLALKVRISDCAVSCARALTSLLDGAATRPQNA